MSADRGHLFVMQGDLTRLAADAYLVPCDGGGNVSRIWTGFVDEGGPSNNADWFLPSSEVEWGRQSGPRLGFLPDPTPTGKERLNPDEVVGLKVLVDTVTPQTIEAMVDHALTAVTAAADRAEKHLGRHLPLVALPILGVSQGNFPGQRAAVVRKLVARLQSYVVRNPIDVVLVMRHSTDFAAAQWARHLAEQEGTPGWPELAERHTILADELGQRAAVGGLALFAGSGISRPVGFPDWKGLLKEFGAWPDSEPTPEELEHLPREAQKLGLADRKDDIAARFRTTKHALAHGLLVGLRATAMVTTNYDSCLENAAAGIPGYEPVVMVDRPALGGKPWLLKLHGSETNTRTIVLAEDDYTQLKENFRAIRGVVQSLMLTNHLLFVGFGFAEDDFLQMSEEVKKVRSLALEEDQDVRVGTALGLTKKTPKFDELTYEWMLDDGGDAVAAARLLEILLDRLAWRCQVSGEGRAAYLLDPEYERDATGDDMGMRTALLHLAAAAKQYPRSSAEEEVRLLLVRLGYFRGVSRRAPS